MLLPHHHPQWFTRQHVSESHPSGVDDFGAEEAKVKATASKPKQEIKATDSAKAVHLLRRLALFLCKNWLRVGQSQFQAGPIVARSICDDPSRSYHLAQLFLTSHRSIPSVNDF
eukprot:6480239-Amphidinium_carterae.3